MGADSVSIRIDRLGLLTRLADELRATISSDGALLVLTDDNPRAITTCFAPFKTTVASLKDRTAPLAAIPDNSSFEAVICIDQLSFITPEERGTFLARLTGHAQAVIVACVTTESWAGAVPDDFGYTPDTLGWGTAGSLPAERDLLDALSSEHCKVEQCRYGCADFILPLAALNNCFPALFDTASLFSQYSESFISEEAHAPGIRSLFWRDASGATCSFQHDQRAPSSDSAPRFSLFIATALASATRFYAEDKEKYRLVLKALKRLATQLEREKHIRAIMRGEIARIEARMDEIEKELLHERLTMLTPLARHAALLGRAVARKALSPIPLSCKIKLKSATLRLFPWLSRELTSAPSSRPASTTDREAPFQSHGPNIALFEKALESDCAKGDLIVFPIIDWRFRFQRPQHLATALGAAGYRVFYLTTDCDFENDGPGFSLVDNPALNIFIVRLNAPLPIFDIHQSAISSKQVAFIAKSLFRFRRAMDMKSLTALVQFPGWRPVAATLSGARIVYDCMDYHRGFSTFKENTQSEESKLIDEADVVVVSSQTLEKRLSVQRPVHIIRNGAEVERFATLPDGLSAKRDGTTIGYLGAIAQWFDSGLVAAAARRHPGWDFLLIGDTTGADLLPFEGLPNVTFTGEVPYSEAPGYIHSFTVGLIPFKLNDLTRSTNPVKVYEYLAAGKPVVATALPELLLMKDHVRIGEDEGTFLSQLDDAVESAKDEALANRRRAWAKAHDWSARAASLMAILDTLSPKVSVVVLTHNNLELTRHCLESIERRTHYQSMELIIVDNASTDGTHQFLVEYKERWPSVTIIFNKSNLGFAAGNNVGLQAATGEYLVLLNNDTCVTDGWLDGLIQPLRRNRSIGILGPATNACDNEAKIDIPYSNMEEMREAAAVYTAAHSGQADATQRLGFFCVAFTRELYKNIGALDERFGLGFFEDDDYCRRAINAGFTPRILRDVFIHHHQSASFDRMGEARKATLHEENLRLYKDKWGGPP